MQTVASYSTGTVDYDHTGGTYERQLTLATGTWPTWATFGRVIIADVHYEVEDYKSSTVLTLREDSNPGADVAASTAYTIYRNAYPLPANFRRLGHLWDIDGQRSIPIVDQQEQHDALVNCYDTPDTPWQASLRGTGDYYGATQLVFGPPPSAVLSYDLMYEVLPRPLKIDQYTAGTVTITSTTTATLTGGVWPASCVGSILRVAATADSPTSLLGDNPYASQHVIKTRTSDTVAVLEEATTNVSGKGFSVSDPIDVEQGMLNAFMRMAEAEFCSAASRKDADARAAKAMMAIVEAKENDQKMPRSGVPAYYDPIKRGRVT